MAIVVTAGRNGLIYVSGHEIEGANSWELSLSQAAIEAMYFAKSWPDREAGTLDWSGSVNAVHDQDSKYLYTMATAGTTVALLIYPKRSDLTTYWSGNAIFSGFNSSGDLDNMVAQSADFSGSGSLTATGFSA
jgi:hypothetical protein